MKAEEINAIRSGLSKASLLDAEKEAFVKVQKYQEAADKRDEAREIIKQLPTYDELLDLLESQLQERDNEITRLKGLFKKCWLDSKTVEGQWCNFFANEGSKRPEYTFEKFCKENNINLTPKQE
jgi:hypothetical protein